MKVLPDYLDGRMPFGRFVDNFGPYWTILDYIKTYWSILDPSVCLEPSLWSLHFGPAYLDLYIVLVYLDLSLWTRLFGTIYLDPSIWTSLFESIHLDLSIWTRIFGPVYIYPSA